MSNVNFSPLFSHPKSETAAPDGAVSNLTANSEIYLLSKLNRSVLKRRKQRTLNPNYLHISAGWIQSWRCDIHLINQAANQNTPFGGVSLRPWTLFSGMEYFRVVDFTSDSFQYFKFWQSLLPKYGNFTQLKCHLRNIQRSLLVNFTPAQKQQPTWRRPGKAVQLEALKKWPLQLGSWIWSLKTQRRHSTNI